MVSTIATEEQERLCAHSFWSAQIDPSVAWELETMCFSEFLEALARQAVRTIDTGNPLSDAKKIRIAYNLLVEMENENPNHK